MDNPILDQSGDTNFSEFLKYSQLYDLPDFVKKAQASEMLPDNYSTSRLFADIRLPYQFPIHNKVATYVSTIYFLEKQSELNPTLRDKIADRLTKAAAYWSISNNIQRLHEKHAELHKEAAARDSDYALVWVTEDGAKEHYYPLRNTLEVKAASDWFVQYLPQLREQYVFEDRQTIADKILAKAAEFGADIAANADVLEKCAARGLCSPSKAASLLQDRTRLNRCTSAVREVMSKLADTVSRRPKMVLDPASMIKLASTVDQFDRAHGILNKYSEILPAPEDVLFGTTRSKTAEFCKGACTLNTGSIFDRAEFSKLSDSDIRGLFGDEVADAVRTGLHVDPEKLAEVASTFPRPDAELFEQLLSSKGLEPVTKQSASQEIGFSFNELKQLSEQLK